MTSAKETGAVNIHQILGDMETMSLLSLIDALVPLDLPVVVTVALLAEELVLRAVVAPLVGVAVVRLILLFMVLHTVLLEGVAPLVGVAVVLHIDLRVVDLTPLVVAVDLPEVEVVRRTLLMVLLMVLLIALRVVALTPLMVAVDTPEEEVVLLVGVAVDRRGLLAPLTMRTLIPESPP